MSHAYTLDHQQEAELFRGLDEVRACICFMYLLCLALCRSQDSTQSFR